MINDTLLKTIENDLLHNYDNIYEKVIPIDNYSYETKKTLDYLIEKYGAFINRYHDKIIVFINTSKNKVMEANDFNTFDKINESLNNIDKRLLVVESKVENLMNKHYYETQNLESYLNYFRNPEEKKELHRLIEEILNHH
ncbi:MAG TPA: hypothetical protein VIK84_01245 [Haloplasmataceae bacterium]